MTEPNARRPNILLVMTDQHRKGAVGCYPNAAGHPVSTPNLDRLAEQGVVFDTAYTTCPVCSPARASLQTGLHPFAHGMQTNLFTSGCMVHELADGPTLLARRLKTLGYTTAYTGKWHLGYGADARSDRRFVERFEDIEAHLHRIELPAEYQRATALPSTRGYDLADDFPGHGGGGHAYPQFEAYLADHGLQRTIDPKSPNRGILTSGPETSVEHFLAERAIHHIDTMNRGDTPWFCALNFWGPHDPAWVPEAHFAPYRDRPLAPWPSFDEDTSDKPSIHAVKRSRAPWSKFECHVRYHYAYVSFIDEQIGRVLDHLARTGCADNTVVIFTADHGDSLGIHGGLMDKSFFLYEDTAAIPLIIHDPRAGEARRDSRPVSLVDLYSTINDLAGDPERGTGRHGRSLMPLVRADSDVGWPEDVVVEASGLAHCLYTQRMLRHGAMKYVFNCGGPDELYNLAEDPHELTNLAEVASARDELVRMQSRLLGWLRRHEDGLAQQFRALRPDAARA